MLNAEQIERPLPRVGDVVGGKYRLLRGIGGGGMGLVYEALHVRLGQHVAIKFMQPKLVGNADSVARFEREGRAASSLTSPHATRIFDVDATGDGTPYIVSEFLVGRDLRAELEERRRLPIREAATYAIQVCAAMAEAHSHGIVHRDLKPSNLFLADTPTGRVVKVVDFGISKVSTEEELDLTTTGTMLGSPRYMSPEQAQAKPADRRADIWSLGVVLFRALSDTYPFEGDTALAMAVATLSERPRDLGAVLPGAPPELASAISKALERDVSQRYDTMRDFADALAPFAPPEMAALAASLTRDVAVPSARTSERDLLRASGVSARASQVDTEAGPALDAVAVPIDVEPTEHQTRPSAMTETSGVRVASTMVTTPLRARWKPFALVAVAVVVLAASAFAVASRTRTPASTSPPVETPAATAPTAPAATNEAPTASAPAVVVPAPAPSAAPTTRPSARATTNTTSEARKPPPPAAPAATTHKNPNYL